jgi:tyrosinase
MGNVDELQHQLDELLRAKPVGVAQALAAEREVVPRMFSAFHLPDVRRATTLAADLVRTAAEAAGSDGAPREPTQELAAALQAAQQLSSDRQHDPELIRHAVKLFVTHYPHGLPIRIQGLEARAPHLILPSKGPNGATAAGAHEVNPEERLLWFREDPKLNEHHEHWHVVYPLAGIPAPGDPRHGQLKERQGELFLYMHRQMLARYDTERLGVGLERVEAWDYRDKDPWGYDPGPYLRPAYGLRAPGLGWEEIPEGTPPNVVMVSVDEMAERGRHLFEAASSGQFELSDPAGAPVRVAVTADLLGATQEADIGSVETSVLPWKEGFTVDEFNRWYNALIVGYYGNFHNVGHDMFGYLSTDPPHNGVMGFVPIAMRDHVFFRWHKLIDELYSTWQETQPSHDFAHDAPPVTIRKSLPDQPRLPDESPDIILCLKDDLIPWDRWEQFGDYAFGGENWDKSFASGTFRSDDMPTGFKTTDELLTEMRRRVVTIEAGAEDPKQPEQPHEIEYLDQREFFYFLRLENLSSQPLDVTVRIFVVALELPELADDRRMWIEMDKFRHSLAARERAVVYRPGALSSVIRKPAVKPPTAEAPPTAASLATMQEGADVPANYCDCGWPYNLLLPRGTHEGMRFRVLVMLTDWNIDNVPEDCDACGSMSYCGARDKYPDSRPMGYPFDSPFRDRTIAETIAAEPNMATRDIVIRWA